MDINKLRNIKLGEYIVFDIIITILIAIAIHNIFLYKYIKRRKIILLSIPISIVIMKLLNIQSPLVDNCTNPHNYYLLKISMIFLIIKSIFII